MTHENELLRKIAKGENRILGRTDWDVLRGYYPEITTDQLDYYEIAWRELLGRNFVKIGSGYHWTPYIIVIAAGISIPLFVILALVSYCKKEY